MPELPEVETTRRGVSPFLIGKRIRSVEVLRTNMVGNIGLLKSEATKSPVKDITRIGKYLFVHFEHGATMIVHLKMSGRLGIRKDTEPELTYERIRFILDDGTILAFNDPRTLGRVSIHPTSEIAGHPSVSKLGPDAIGIGEQDFVERLNKRKGILKAVLLDQSFVAGIGNIYADEACFLAKIRPTRLASGLSQKEKKTLYRAVIATLTKGIDNMGTSFSDFADLFGKPGRNQNTLMVYGRKGKPCFDCGTILSSATVGQRTTVWCGHCQR